MQRHRLQGVGGLPEEGRNEHFGGLPRLGGIAPEVVETDIKVMDKVQSPDGRLSTLARFAVTPDAPGLHTA